MNWQVVIVYTLLLVFPLVGCNHSSKKKRPNIIYLMADDQRGDAIGVMGNTNIITPNLDQLAHDGVIFENAYSVVPICKPSRASVMTGQYLGTHGVGFDSPTNYVMSEKEFSNSYPVLLRKAGYFTGFIGKFGFPVSKDSKIKDHRYEHQEKYMPKDKFSVWNGFTGQGRYLPRNGKMNGYENKWNEKHLTPFIGGQAIAFLDSAKKSQKPFCLSVSFKAPHYPLIPDERVLSLYDQEQIPRMVNDSPKYYKVLPEVVKKKSRNANRYFGRDTTYYGKKVRPEPDWHLQIDSTYQKFIKNYYALITGLDQQVGRIRKKLKQLGMAKNTVIIFTSDNGFFAGARQLTGKALLYDESSKVPMVVYDPRMKNQDQSHVMWKKGLISEIDIAPTILDLAGVEISKNYPGRSFMPIVRGDTSQIHEAVYGENNFDDFYPIPSEISNPENYQSIRSKFVRTQNYKYIRYQETKPMVEELFRISKDTLENKNLINDPKYREVADQMRTRLDSFVRGHVKYENKNYYEKR